MVKRTINLRRYKGKKWSFVYGQRRVQILADKLLVFNLMKNLHGRFWGVAGVIGLIFGFSICFIIRPELLAPSTALSDFGEDVRTAPYFAGTCFFAAYGLWRWRDYLGRTIRRSRPMITLITMTIVGLYLVALMPASWKPWPYRVHLVGVSLIGISIALTVVFDTLLSKTREKQNAYKNRLIKFIAFFLIVVGGWLTLGSLNAIAWYDVSLLGEGIMLLGYTIWVVLKTYQGEEPRSALSRLLKKIVLVD